MGSKKRGKVKGEQGRKDVGKRQLELTYIFPFRFSHSLHSLPNFPLKNATSQTKRPGSKCIQKRLPAITMASTRARPEWRHTIKISNTPSATAAGDKSTDRDYKYPNFPPPPFFPFYWSWLKVAQQRRRRQIGFFPREYISGGEWTRRWSWSLWLRSRVCGRELRPLSGEAQKRCWAGRDLGSWQNVCRRSDQIVGSRVVFVVLWRLAC